MLGQAPTAVSRPRKSAAAVIFLCFVAIVFDGYDLVVYGAIVPKLLAYQDWGLTPVQTGAIGSYALAGMFIGAILIGYLTDILGRRRVLMGSIAFFSLLMLLTAWAPTPELFGIFRFLAGLGLGGVIPTAIALTVEFSKSHRRNFNNALMFSGYAVGGIMAALLALALLSSIGFRGMLAIGGLPLIIVLPFLFKFLPESPAFLAARGRRAEAEELIADYGLEPLAPAAAASARAKERGRFRTLLTGRVLAATVLFSLAGICGQILVYGLNTWLPQLMVLANYSLASSLSFLLTVNVGAVVGVIVSSRLADKFGPRVITAVSFVCSGTALLVMGSGIAPLPAMYLLVAVVGFGSVGAQILINGYVATYYSAATRATALGITLGVGRIGAVLAISGGGILVAASLGNFVNFSIWAIAAAVGVVAVLAVPAARAGEPVAAVTDATAAVVEPVG
ncbi:AAHS family benzoate transporter-like MFS transporter [Arthrobacter ginsengisoli]|uniref:AAHS family benzoate transporter-like MFS transporter n=1 Tax=Arthrobacter ginsengisoli TaxID=1356565 RepID=A0ABU1UFH2_9MICC|nr:aromatic acid/H+ symport family MFS transporter [Arthrobacter ginsengisoli]MDR7083885.1 AAHS family benzoate transporter-like MFS transporter [Arthrobacter ginsengisoli]